MQRVHGNIKKVQLSRRARKDRGISRINTAAQLSGLKGLLPHIDSDGTKQARKTNPNDVVIVGRDIKVLNDNHESDSIATPQNIVDGVA